MADYETEEEQVEAIKAWWKKNGGAITTGVVLGVAVVFGWKMFQDYQVDQALSASYHYEQVLSASEQDNHDTVLDVTKTLTTSYADSNYAVLSSLLAAKSSIDNGKLDDAAKYLTWAKDNAPVDLASIARIRLARVQIAQNNYEQALTTLDYAFSEQVSSEIEEVKGDAFYKMGKLQEAKTAYEKALTSITNGQRKTDLEMKLYDLAV